MSAAPEAGILATVDQDAVEERALALVRSAPMQEQIERTRRRYASDPLATVAGGRDTLEKAVHELAWAAMLVAVNTEPTHPRIAWVYAAPRSWRGRAVPGSRWGIDNPDNVYRIAPVDGRSRYEVRCHGAGPVQFSFLTYSHFVGEEGHQKDVDAPLGGLRSDEIRRASDGSFVLTLDPEPAAGRPNHIQTAPDIKQLLIRNTMGDWVSERPLAMTIERVGGPPADPPATDAVLARRCAAFLEALTSLSLNWKKQSLFGHWRDNVLCAPYGRGRQWGFAASGNFNLAEDEALLVTVDPLEARYLGFCLTDLWLASLDHVDRQGSLNGQQAQPNADGTYTYVIAARDPGFDNWLDTGGLRQGSMLYRWQVLPPSRTSAEGAVREVRCVKLGELRHELPAGAHFMTTKERADALRRRAREYELRYTTVTPETHA
ncbi:MAG TPA: hypothetical protein VJQ47_08585 [Steroidobacteraceae bacterium]|nr:hypothetical protein [Steroidobacteraceae bacterium]